MPRKPGNSIATVRQAAQRAEFKAREAKAKAEAKAWGAIEASYTGGVGTRLSESWQPAQGFRFGTSLDRMQVGDARSRAYQAYDNNPVARALVQTETDNVIGDGVNYQPASDSEEWNKEAKDKYYDWVENASVRGPDVHSGCELQRMIWDRSRVAGDIGWILVSRGLESRIQVVPAENIVSPDDSFKDTGIYDGIKFDTWGRPVTFYVRTHDDSGSTRKTEAIAARDFVYFGHLTKPNQARPESCYITIFDLLAHLDRYVDGVALASWMATVMGIIFKQNNASRQLNALGTLTNSQGEQQKAITFENGMVKYIGTDEDVAQVQAHQPMQQTPDFIRAMMRQIGLPFDMPLEVFAKDMSTCNFASARIGLLPFYRKCRINFSRFGARWSRTIRWWLSRERLRPNDDPKKWTTKFPENYWAHELLVNAWDYTDPVSEVQSDMLQVDAKFKSTQMVHAERGRDTKQILADLEQWQKDTANLPEVHSTMTREPKPDPAATTGGPPAPGAKPVAPDPKADFSQDVVRAWMVDKDKRDAAWNISDVPAVFTEAGVKLDPSVDSADGEGVPMLPDVPEDEPAT